MYFEPKPKNQKWCGMVEVCEGAPSAMARWVLTERHDLVARAAVCTCFRQP